MWMGLLLLGVFLVYMISTVLKMKRTGVDIQTVRTEEDSSTAVSESELEKENGEDFVVELKEKGTKDNIIKDILLLVVGAVLIAVGADLLVDNAIIIAQRFGVPEKVIGLTIVALGTSLPELVTAITSLVKGHGALSLGNIIGANLFNLVLVSGVATTISPFAVPKESILFGQPASLVMDIPVMLGVMLLLVIPTLIRQKLSRVQGIVLLCIYAGFCTLQFVM
jgi:cation:H+ antiporter